MKNNSPRPVLHPTIFHIEDEPLLSTFIGNLIGTWPEFIYIGSTASATQGIATCREKLPSVVLLDIGLPGMDGFAAVRELNALPHPPRILLLTARADDATLYRISTHRVSGLLWKLADTNAHLRKAIQTIADGGTYFPPEVREFVGHFRSSPLAFFKILSERELDLLKFFGRGETDAAIAESVGLSLTTVRSHRHHIMQKLGIHRSEDLMRWIEEKGFAEAKRPAPPCISDRD